VIPEGAVESDTERMKIPVASEATIKQVREASHAIQVIMDAFAQLAIPEGSKLMRGTR